MLGDRWVVGVVMTTPYEEVCSVTGEMEVFVRKVWVWLSRRVLPVWAREALLGQIRELEEENRRLRQEVALKEEYIHGLKWGVRAQRRAVAEEGKG